MICGRLGALRDVPGAGGGAPSTAPYRGVIQARWAAPPAGSVGDLEAGSRHSCGTVLEDLGERDQLGPGHRVAGSAFLYFALAGPASSVFPAGPGPRAGAVAYRKVLVGVAQLGPRWKNADALDALA